MSRRDGRPVTVFCADNGTPTFFYLPGSPNRAIPIRAVRDHWREWFDIALGEPERDVWQAETPLGLIELHHVYPTGDEDNGHWLLARWED